MTKSSSQPLKLHDPAPPKVVPPQIETLECLPDLLRAFQKATGWSLRYVAGPEPRQRTDARWSAPVSPGVGASPGHLRLDPLRAEGAAARPVELDAARSLAAALGDVLSDLVQTRRALWHREAELAAGIPLVPHANEELHLAARLEAVLKGGADAVEAQAAAIYLLDDATTSLKLRSCWGLPLERLRAPARPLQGAVADLEAMLGHAVVLQDPEVMRFWRVPEDFPAAVCVPISTPTTILGTLWIFATENRDFSDQQTNIIEVVAGRVAADLEREMLLREGFEGAQLKKQVAAAERLQRNQLPTIAPMLDGWDIAGWSTQSEGVGGNFHDWFCVGDGLLAVAAGHALDRGVAAALSATTLKTALRCHGQYHRQAEQVLRRANLTLWTGSAGDQFATLFYGLVETATGNICCASAGEPSLLLVGPDGWRSLTETSPCLGEGPETVFEQFGHELQSGQTLVIWTSGRGRRSSDAGRGLEETRLGEALAERHLLRAEQLVASAREFFAAQDPGVSPSDRTIVVVKRTPA